MDWSPPPAVLYGLLIITVVGATTLCFYMRFGRSASLAVALAWLLTMLVMMGGVGKSCQGMCWQATSAARPQSHQN